VAPEGSLILDDTVKQRILIMHHLTELVGLTAVATQLEVPLCQGYGLS
jgi:hypothetical protein